MTGAFLTDSDVGQDKSMDELKDKDQSKDNLKEKDDGN